MTEYMQGIKEGKDIAFLKVIEKLTRYASIKSNIVGEEKSVKTLLAAIDIVMAAHEEME